MIAFYIGSSYNCENFTYKFIWVFFDFFVLNKQDKMVVIMVITSNKYFFKFPHMGAFQE